MCRTFDDLLKLATCLMSQACYRRLLQNDPQHHAPNWHVYGVLGHIYAVIEAAKLFKQLTLIDVVAEATLHDAGKLWQFPKALDVFDAQGDPSDHYQGHERLSAQYARSVGLPTNSLIAIEWHQFGYLPIGTQNLLAKLRCKEAARKWMALCTCDAAGKGFRPAQSEQRQTGMPRHFEEIGRLTGLDEKFVQACCHAVQTWQPAKVPRFK